MRRARVIACLLGLALAATAATDADEKTILGWIEEVVVGEAGLRLEAKLDTGADTSSIDAVQIRRLRGKRTGKRTVEFAVLDPATDELVWFKKPLVRMAYIKQHSGRSQERPVVELDICVGEIARRVEFTLVSRAGFDYPVLLGREAMEDVIIVDPGIVETTSPACDRDGGEDGS